MDRWTLHRPEGAKDAAVAWFRTQQRVAVLALVKELTGVGAHGLALDKAASRAREVGLKNERP